jgi:uncharacterized RDD family membrane protein YckC
MIRRRRRESIIPVHREMQVDDGRRPMNGPGVPRTAASAARIVLLPITVLRLAPRSVERLGVRARAAVARQIADVAEDAVASPAAGRVVDRALRSSLPETVARSVVERHVAERVVRTAYAHRDEEATAAELDRLLRSEEFDLVLERVLSSPAFRAALASQRATMAGELAAGIRGRCRAFDDAVERPVRRAFGRAPRAVVDATLVLPPGGFVSRGGALAVDAVIANVVFAVGAALTAAIGSLTSIGVHNGYAAGFIAATAWIVLNAAYFAGCWSLTGQTPGMRIFGVRVIDRLGLPPRPGRALLRLAGVLLAIIPLFAGFLPALVDDRRRALPDYVAGTTVVQDDLAAT